ncbi:MAG: FkbM family methyltransferase [Rhodobacter sp.]|nr:FkbM family methyltransferase [Rhodobacter sp.]
MEQPGRVTLELAHLWRKLTGRRRRAQRAAKRAFAAALARLGPGDLAIDLGANAGEFTVPLAQTGAEVHAFEPDPHALARLRMAVSGYENVTLHDAAAGGRAGVFKLYRSKLFGRDPDRRSKSSSLLAEKRNVSGMDAIEVQVVDFVGFLRALDREVALIKMDIEGAEVELLEALLASPEAGRVGEIFVETHERALPHLAGRTAALRARAAGLVRPRINWDWH